MLESSIMKEISFKKNKWRYLTCFIPKKLFEEMANSICSKSNVTFKKYFIKEFKKYHGITPTKYKSI